MAGHLQQNPYLKTNDELERSINRMQTYHNLNKHLLPDKERERLNELIEHLAQAKARIPQEFQRKRYQRR